MPDSYASHEICTYIFYHLISTSQTNIYIFSMKIPLTSSHLISMSQIIYVKDPTRTCRF